MIQPRRNAFDEPRRSDYERGGTSYGPVSTTIITVLRLHVVVTRTKESSEAIGPQERDALFGLQYGQHADFDTITRAEGTPPPLTAL